MVRKTATQLDAEIATALAAGPPVTITVRAEDTDSDDDTDDEEHYTISDNGDEFDDAAEIAYADVQGDIDERRLHYRDLGRTIVLDAPAGRGWL